MSKFQLILLIVFGAFIVIAVILFSSSRGGGTAVPNVVVWGTIPRAEFDTFLLQSDLDTNDVANISYVELSASTFDTEFTEALALGRGPDLVILTQERFWRNREKLLPIPTSSINQKDFNDTFIEEGEIFYTAEGIYALPLVVDPLVLYWNRDLFSKASLPNPPAFWDETYSFAQTLTERDGAGNIIRSGIALGEGRNIPRSKDILSLLMLQAGTPITGFSTSGLRAELTNSFGLPTVPAHAALDFYTQFSNPVKPYYSWNRSLRPADTLLASGDLAMYVGFASELRTIRAKNPTLNLGVTSVPQSRVSNNKITFGRLYAVSIARSTRNPNAAWSAALLLTSNNSVRNLSQTLLLPPARRDLLSERPADLANTVFYESAIQSKGWIDPDTVRTAEIFMEMIDSVTSGRARTSEAVNNAQSQINSLIR